ncbi:MAG: tRNA (adenosine(37)-N6)-threonylcarbamoyltransferase complex ATPase subunit type 1 TsaE [Bryobacterales bacterium]|nr:tRNA (adenosine(37)-N6)-threonylcarbamoyltransferase complex ATPase subunit type 1 TsaE [Bryobacterales bacterium]
MLALGRSIGEMLPRRHLVYLIGDLGAGKTTLTKGIVEGLGAGRAEEVSSPTFTLIHEYGDPVRVYHIDLYRLESARELAGLGLEEILERDAVVIIEWPDRFARWLPAPDLTVRITHDHDARRVYLDPPVTFGQ